MRRNIIYLANSKKNIIHLLEYILLDKEGYEIKSFSNGRELIKNISADPGVVIIDKKIAKESLLEKIEIKNDHLPVIVLSENKDGMVEFENRHCTFIEQSGFFIDKIVETVEKE